MASIEDVTDHGATGDGTTDDAGAIKAAIDAAGDGGLVLIPPPAVAYRCKLIRVQHAVKILGMGRRPLLQRFTPSGNSSIVFEIEHDGVHIENLSIDCKADINFATCIHGEDVDDVVVKDCYLYSSDDPGDDIGGIAPTIHAVVMEGVSNVLVEGNRTHFTEMKLSGNSIGGVAGPGIRVINNHGTFCHDAGISCVTFGTEECSDVLIRGNVMHNCYLGGIYVGSDGDADVGGQFRRVVITDNILSGRKAGSSGSLGIVARAGDAAEDWIIANNIVFPGSDLGVGEEYHTGINVRSTDTAGPLRRCIVSNNCVSGAGRWGIRCTMFGGELILTGNQAADDEGILVQADGDGELLLVCSQNISRPDGGFDGITLQTLDTATISGVASNNVSTSGNTELIEATPGSISLQAIDVPANLEDFSEFLDSVGAATRTVAYGDPPRRGIVFLEE